MSSKGPTSKGRDRDGNRRIADARTKVSKDQTARRWQAERFFLNPKEKREETIFAEVAKERS